jgi:hypothetical protein
MNPIAKRLSEPKRRRPLFQRLRSVFRVLQKNIKPRPLAWTMVILFVLLFVLGYPILYVVWLIEGANSRAYKQFLWRAATTWDAGRIDEALAMLRQVYRGGIQTVPRRFDSPPYGSFAGINGHFLVEDVLYECEVAVGNLSGAIALADRWLKVAPEPLWVARKAHALVGMQRVDEAKELVRTNAGALQTHPAMLKYCTALLGPDLRAVPAAPES